MRTIPNSVIGLIEELEADFPPLCIAEDQTELQAHRYAGKVELVVKLRARYEAGMKKEQKGLPTILK